MGEDIQATLNANGFENVNVNMSGNVARLTGQAPNEAAAATATELAAKTKCKKCAEKDSWHKVVNDIDYASVATASPYIFNAVKSDDGAIVLDGYVRNEAEKARVLREAENLFPGKVSDRTIKIAAGEPNANWGDVISRHLNDVSLLQRGRFNIENDKSFISGLAADAATKARVETAFSSLPSGYTGQANVTLPVAEVVAAPAAEAQATCQALMDELKGANKINFESNKAGIKGEASFNLLNRLGEAANAEQCSSMRISVVGHTDSGGSDEYNQGLSERRAASVVAYLVQEQNVDIARISAEGMGETSPVADNATPEGRAANRRIEFIVTQAQ